MPIKVQHGDMGADDRSENLGLMLSAVGSGAKPLWALDIVEITGHNIEARGRTEVNTLLQAGWILLHIYTLRYPEDGVWRDRPMAILGRPKGVAA